MRPRKGIPIYYLGIRSGLALLIKQVGGVEVVAVFLFISSL